jgi:hypothetical protein
MEVSAQACMTCHGPLCKVHDRMRYDLRVFSPSSSDSGSEEADLAYDRGRSWRSNKAFIAPAIPKLPPFRFNVSPQSREQGAKESPRQ